MNATVYVIVTVLTGVDATRDTVWSVLVTSLDDAIDYARKHEADQYTLAGLATADFGRRTWIGRSGGDQAFFICTPHTVQITASLGKP